MSRIITAIVVTSSTLGLSVVTATASAATGDQVSTRLQRAVADLPVARETRAGYDRDKFLHWIDANSDCQDTRDEVLAAESRVNVSGCDIQTGQWRSYYDGATTTDSTAFDIDHLVALAEAWDSGAKRWNADTRKRYANDLGDRRSLVAVTASSNRSKSDRDVAEWLPQLGRCRYVREWVAVKIRWRLNVDRPEKRALRSLADDCPNSRIKITRAAVHTASEGGPGGGATGGGGGGGGGLDPRFDYCYQAIAAGYGPYYRGQDPEYHWYTDSDDDGVVCE